MSWWYKEGNRFFDRSEQLEKLMRATMYDKMPSCPDEYWQIVKEVWTRQEFPYNDLCSWHDIFASNPGFDSVTHDWISSGNKTVYRGGKHELDLYGHSWTTDYDKALWFANRFYSDGYVFETTANKNNIWTYVGGSESEVILCVTGIGPECIGSDGVEDIQEKLWSIWSD